MEKINVYSMQEIDIIKNLIVELNGIPITQINVTKLIRTIEEQHFDLLALLQKIEKLEKEVAFWKDIAESCECNN